MSNKKRVIDNCNKPPDSKEELTMRAQMPFSFMAFTILRADSAWSHPIPSYSFDIIGIYSCDRSRVGSPNVKLRPNDPKKNPGTHRF